MNAPDTSGKNSRRRYNSSVFQLPAASAVIIVDGKKKKVRTYTADAERLTGIPSDKISGKSLNVLPPTLKKIIRRVLTTGKPVQKRRVTLPGKNKITLYASAAPLECGKKNSGAVLVLSDAAAPAQQFEENIGRLERLASVGTLSASMTHEIKNAFVAVKTFVELLLDQNKDAELAEVVRRELGRIDSLVGQTLKFGGPARPTFTTARANEVVDFSLRMVQPLLKAKDITLTRSLTDAADMVEGDEFQLEQAFVNLLLNAIEAMGPGGSLGVTTDVVPSQPGGKEGSGLRITITDSGMGITLENMSKLFDPFFTTKENGTGLGLSITRRIVEEHRGSIHVHSEVRKGTTFIVVLPAHGH